MTCESDKSVDLRDYPNDPETKESVIESRRELFKDLGFSDNFIEKLENNRETLYTKESIRNKIEGLKERGFKDPVKMITTFLPVLGYGFENIDIKIEGLKERGFKDPVKMITTLPPVLSHGFENIDIKIEGLKERGFKDPVKMITTFPSVLGLGFENIDRKIGMLNKIINLYKLNLTTVEIIEKNLSLLGTKIDKLWVLARIAKESTNDPDQINHIVIGKLLFSNLENIILATRTRSNMTIGEVIKESKEIKKQNIPKAEKREQIASLPFDDKVRQRYFRGYPMKTD
jgi:hypothetical protein